MKDSLTNMMYFHLNCPKGDPCGEVTHQPYFKRNPVALSLFECSKCDKPMIVSKLVPTYGTDDGIFYSFQSSPDSPITEVGLWSTTPHHSRKEPQ